MSPRPIHRHKPDGMPHPFKFQTLCGRMVRFGGAEIPEIRKVTCKVCLSVINKGQRKCGCGSYDYCDVHGSAP